MTYKHAFRVLHVCMSSVRVCYRTYACGYIIFVCIQLDDSKIYRAQHMSQRMYRAVFMMIEPSTVDFRNSLHLPAECQSYHDGLSQHVYTHNHHFHPYKI